MSRRGRHGEELEDMDDVYRPSKPRRRSNASAQLLDAMTSKFEVVEAEPMFKENIHGASASDYALEKTMSNHHFLRGQRRGFVQVDVVRQ
jgi:hypothetical protein